MVRSAEEMGRLAAELGGQLQPGAIVYLTGELGAGKTTFVAALARFFGVTRPVTSSTFVLMSSYAVKSHPVINKLIHVDLYRLTPEQVRGEALVGDLFDEPPSPKVSASQGQITVIEWADRLDKKSLPAGWWVWFEHVDPATRVVRWEYGPRT